MSAKMLVLDEQQQKKIARNLTRTLGYEIRSTDLRLFGGKQIRVVSIDGICFHNGRPQEPRWGTESELSKRFESPTEEYIGKVDDYEIRFDSSFFPRQNS